MPEPTPPEPAPSDPAPTPAEPAPTRTEPAPPRNGPAVPARRARSGYLPILLPLGLLVVVAVVVGSWFQISERQTIDTVHAVGSEARDRVDVRATVQRVDAGARELVLRVRAEPRGALGADGGLVPVGDLLLQTSAATAGDLSFKGGERLTTKDVRVALTGAIGDYPFDRYEADVEFGAVLGGEPVPVRLLFSNNDALFAVDAAPASVPGQETLAVELVRSGSALVFAVFMMIVMWALAGSVLIGTWYLTTRGEGIVWPALSWMAATLFALAAFRNTAPGAPPIGCLMDWIAFLWAETLIALCIIAVVLTGIRGSLHPTEEPRAEEPQAP
ncbi:DUF4436 family protein (plasmid) [Streptomyces sp. BI20]|uniref:DUF4436 family protein n=1 Tax=Streptomyces sp. BI20 TaxID=3403460 RepID=UPI003C7219AF